MPRFSASKLTDNTGDKVRSSETKGTIKSKQGVAIRSKQEDMSAGMEDRNGFALKLDLSNDNLLNGILLAELLGKPKCLKRGRW